MTIALRFNVKFVLLAIGVLLGLLAVALVVWPQAAGSHAGLVDAAKLHYVGKLRPLGVLWH